MLQIYDYVYFFMYRGKEAIKFDIFVRYLYFEDTVRFVTFLH